MFVAMLLDKDGEVIGVSTRFEYMHTAIRYGEAIINEAKGEKYAVVDSSVYENILKERRSKNGRI